MPHDNDHGKVSILQSVAGAICGVVVVGKGRSPICAVGRGCIKNESMFSRGLVNHSSSSCRAACQRGPDMD